MSKSHINHKETSDLVGYETLIEYLENNKTCQLEGDFLEIGALKGGGSAKLARYGRDFRKTLFVVDIFDPSFDITQNDKFIAMSQMYKSILGRSNQRSIFNKNTNNEKNIVVYAQDSKYLQLGKNIKLCFSFIDGNHSPEYVTNDFNLAWSHTIPDGIVGFHDYSYDLPLVTKAINNLLTKNSSQISRIYHEQQKHILFVHKKGQTTRV